LYRWRLLNLRRFTMTKIILTATVAGVAMLAVNVQPAAACGITNGVADGHGVFMFAATLVFAVAAGTVTMITQPQSATANPSGGVGQDSPEVCPTGSRC
jgi:hypothetical protein